MIRHWFNTQHARKGNPHWTWAAAVVIFLLIAWLSSAPKLPTGGEEVAAPSAQAVSRQRAFRGRQRRPSWAAARCATAAEPVWEGIYEAPKNVRLDSDAAIANHAQEIAIQAGYSHAMPPGNVTEMTDDERALIVAWYREASAR